jgi:hypothetical protein
MATGYNKNLLPSQIITDTLTYRTLFGDRSISNPNTFFARITEKWRHDGDVCQSCSIIFFQCHHMSLMDFVVSPPGCGRSVTDFWGRDTHEAQLRCPDQVDGDIWIWSTRRVLSSTKLPRPWSPWESSPSRKNPHCRVGNRTRDLMISSQKLWRLDHEAGLIIESKDTNTIIRYRVSTIKIYGRISFS